MRLLLVYYEPQPSGQTTHVLSLVRGLSRRHKIAVVLPEQFTDIAEAIEQAGAQTYPLPLRKVVWPRQAIQGLLRLIRKGRFDVVHVHSQEVGLVARPIARLAGALTVVYTPQTTDIRQARWQGLYRAEERVLSWLTEAIVSVNEADRQKLVRWGLAAHKVVTIPNGLDLATFDESEDTGAIRDGLGFGTRSPLVMQAGRLCVQKDPFTFVAGAARVIQERGDVQFALLGDGPLREAVTAEVLRLKLDGAVRLMGWRAEAWRLLKAADLVTLTSRWEGTPYALLEAMAWSRPVVATAVNGCPEVVADGSTGLLVPPGDSDTWARAVLALLNDPERAAAMGVRGRKRVEERYTAGQMVSQLEALYQRLTGRE